MKLKVAPGFEPGSEAAEKVVKFTGKVVKIYRKSRGGSHLGAAQALSCRVVGLGGHIDVIIVTMTITVTKLYHPFGAAPLLGLQTVLRVPARTCIRH